LEHHKAIPKVEDCPDEEERLFLHRLKMHFVKKFNLQLLQDSKLNCSFDSTKIHTP